MISVSLRRGLFALGVAGFLATPAALAETTFTPEELERDAQISLQQGDPVRALAFADALAARDKTDVTPHLLRARALRDIGRYGEAKDAARTAWKLSRSEEEKYSSALIMAQALSSDDKKTRAQLWLRRAVQHAPSPQLAHHAKRHFKYVQQQNPWKTNLSFTLAPNSNINNGSSRETSQLNYALSDILYGGPVEYNLTGATRALSGFEYGFDVNSSYRFLQTSTTAHDVVMSLDYSSYVLSGSARDVLEEAKAASGSTDPIRTGSDFAFGYASLGYSFKQLNYDGKGEFSAFADIGQTWYGGDRYSSIFRGQVTQSYRLSKVDRVKLGLKGVISNGQQTYDSELAEVLGIWDRRLTSGNNLHMVLSYAEQSASDTDAEFREVGFRSGLSLGKPVMGAALQFGLDLGYRTYDVSRHDPSGRQDLKVTADVTAVFRQIDYYGFNPSVTLSASSTVSNINLYDSNRVGLSIGIRSAF